MKKKNDEPKVRVYTRKCYPMYIAIYYRILIHRISQNLSPKEMSFLMGKPLDFMTKVERIKFIRWMISDFFRIEKSLNIDGIEHVFPIVKAYLTETFLYQISIKTYEDYVVYDMKKMDSEKEVFIDEFQLIDQRCDVNIYQLYAESEIQEVRDWLKILFEEGYFQESRTPLEIYKKNCVDFENRVKPIVILTILHEQVNLKDFPTIKRVESKNGAYYIATSAVDI
ncbi:hypothetical protein [Sphingobacterium paucimobilis]|uniref:Uncharacterized protein n=1 Tax=Sphingobacterium paucimobilis HER1398 TaxID=1346330 RepID=U2J756_9SPHI|nr:hypothetical protein [Sphingobacterium paucimobilis]ERJ60759.1 hypothetical protein M472_18535 [Sphingobacterium paucimobilis HER1398]